MITPLPGSILFDLDGTLLDSLPGIEFSVRAAFASCGLPLVHENLRGLIGPPIRTILSQAGDVRQGSSLDALEMAFRLSYDSEGWRKTTCYPDAVVVLRTLREQAHRLFVISNKPRHISVQILEREAILDLFEEIVTRDSRSPAYPGKEEMIRHLLAEHGLSPDDCLIIGDTMEDAIAAATNGIRFLCMTHGYGAGMDAPTVLVDWKLDSFSQLLPQLTKELVRD
jgi:phosphoglycolate phosphatase